MMVRAVSPQARTGLAPVLALLVLAFSTSLSQAQTPTEAEIVNALTPSPLTRGLSTGTPGSARTGSSEDADFIDTLRTTRSLSVGQRERLASVAEGKPSIDLEIRFAFASAAISPKTRPIVDSLGAALSRPGLKDGTFMIAGHTDAKGGVVANQQLSEKRAVAVKQYLVDKFKIPATNLVTVGFGKDRLKNKEIPFAEENRRVQATNLTDFKSVSR